MKEKFILADGISGNELARSLAKSGINSFGMRVFSGATLAKEALLRCGYSINKKTVSRLEQASIVYSFLNEIEYFKYASYVDALNLVKSFHVMRSTIVDGDELDEITAKLKKGPFSSKNNAILEAFTRYSNYLYQNDLIDNDGIVRCAIQNSKYLDVELICLKEFPISPAQKKLLEVVGDGVYQEISINDLYCLKKLESKVLDAFKAYGAVNEAEHIIEDIYLNHKLDECVIACTNEKAYSQLFYDLSLQYNIPITFGTGISVNNSNPAKLLKVLVKWDSEGHNGIDGLFELLSCEALDWDKLNNFIGLDAKPDDELLRKLCDYVGNLKLSFDDKTNHEKLQKIKHKDEMYKLANKLAEAFKLGLIGFLEAFVSIRNNNLDQSALAGIIKEIKIFEKYNPDKLLSEVIPQISGENMAHELSEPSKLHVTNLKGLFSCPRKYVYVCGLSANFFPGGAKENYLLLDEDLEHFKGSVSSKQHVLNKIKIFEEVTNFIESLDCIQKYSYSFYDLSELKEQNASSVLYKHINPDDLKKVNYFDANLSMSHDVCDAYKKGVEISLYDEAKQITACENLMDKDWSFSAIDTYFTCPRKFYLSCVSEIPEQQKTDPFEIINAAEFGSLAHDMMELLGKNKPDKEAFLETCEKAFESILIKKVAIVKNKAESVKADFIHVMSIAYDFDLQNTNKIGFSEKYLKAKHENSGLNLIGRPDRIENNGSDNIVVDFKTGRNIKHVQEDATSCLQALIYAFLCEKNNIKISSGEFRYLRNCAVIKCSYDDNSRHKMDDILCDFAKGISENNFERCTKNCRYCSYGDICLLPGELDDEEGGLRD